MNSNAVVNLCAAVMNRITTFNHRMKSRAKFIEKLKKINQDESLPFIEIEVPSMLKIEFPNDLDKEYVELFV